MTKKIILFIAILIVIGGGTALILKNKQSKQEANQNSVSDNAPVARVNNDQLIMFYGNGCPHCELIEDYITAEKLDKKLNIELKEVWYDKTNAAELKTKATTCGIAEDQIGVPLILDTTTSKCYVGEDEAKQIFNEKLNAPQQ